MLSSKSTQKSPKQGAKETEENPASEFAQSFSGKKILISGGASFLGSWLGAVISKTGGVDCVDNLSTGQKENLQSLRENLRFIQSLAEECDLEENYDYIFHFASRASPEEYQQYPVQTLRANSIGTMKMLELARKNSEDSH